MQVYLPEDVSALLCGSKWFVADHRSAVTCCLRAVPPEWDAPNEIFCLLVSLAKLGDACTCAVKQAIADALKSQSRTDFVVIKGVRSLIKKNWK